MCGGGRGVCVRVCVCECVHVHVTVVELASQFLFPGSRIEGGQVPTLQTLPTWYLDRAQDHSIAMVTHKPLLLTLQANARGEISAGFSMLTHPPSKVPYMSMCPFYFTTHLHLYI